MTQPPSSPRTSWTPPAWLVVLDLVGFAALGLGLLMQFSPDSDLAQALPPAARVPLLILGGVALLLAWYAMIRMLLAARPRG